MIKKVTIVSLVFTLLTGIAAPLLAGLEMQEQACEMSCCMMAQTEKAQTQNTDTTPVNPCTEMNSCLPGDQHTQESLAVEAEAPRTKVKFEDYPATTIIGIASNIVHEKTDQFRTHFSEVFSNLFKSSREKLAEHSILII